MTETGPCCGSQVFRRGCAMKTPGLLLVLIVLGFALALIPWLLIVLWKIPTRVP